MAGKKSRDKGARGERELSALLRAEGYENAKRGQQFCGINGNADVIDALPHIHIECKRVERLQIYDAINQSKRDARDGELATVFHRKNNCEWLVTMPFDEWIKVYREFEASMSLKESEENEQNADGVESP